MSPKTKERIDVLLVSRGLYESRSKAQSSILAGEVFVAGQKVDKVGTLVFKDAAIEIKKKQKPYVSRGGFKLEAAIAQWPCPIEGMVCIDVGASTGGFTDVLLQHGAKQVFCVDVGYGQLHFRLRNDPRVHNLEKTHIVHVPLGTFVPAPQIAVVDVSFISLTRVLPAVLRHLDKQAFLYVLIKPQFEVGPKDIHKGGIVKDPIKRQEALERILSFMSQLGLKLVGYSQSPILGADGNVEYIAALSQ